MTQVGGRIPTISFLPNSTRLNIVSPINDNNHRFKTPKLPMHKWTNIVVSQDFQSNGKYMYMIALDGKIKHKVINRRPRTFTNVQIYIANFRPASAEINNIKIVDVGHKFWSSKYIKL